MKRQMIRIVVRGNKVKHLNKVIIIIIINIAVTDKLCWKIVFMYSRQDAFSVTRWGVQSRVDSW